MTGLTSTMRAMQLGLLAGALALAGCGGGGGGGDADGGGGDGDGGGDGGGGTDGSMMDSGPGTGTEGTPCTRTAQCMEGLYCSDARVCEPAGSGGEDELCDSTADCQRGFVCVFESGSRTCQPAGSGGEGDTCVDDADCVAGLYCNDEAECSAEPPEGGSDGGSPDADLGDAGLTCEAVEDCDDDSPCTTDMCIGNFCENTLRDIDEDGYADSQVGDVCGDCNDNDDTVNPDHEEFESEQHDGNLTTGPSWDWNCDGTLEKQWPSTVTCTPDSDCDGEGWLGSVPDCGASGTYVRCTGSGLSCTTETVEAGRVQECR